MTNLKQASLALKEILGLRHEPVAVKFFPEDKELDGFRRPPGGKYCAMIIGARHGKKHSLSPDVECKPVAWTLGVKVPPDKPSLTNPIDALKSKYKTVASCPLAEAPFEPDVVIIDATPVQFRWITLIHETGREVDPKAEIAPDTPVDTAILSFPVCRANGTTALYCCMRCHITHEPFDDPCMLGFPVKDLDNIVHSLEQLKQ
jgi:uncharacterized protein (DUF169 family)